MTTVWFHTLRSNTTNLPPLIQGCSHANVLILFIGCQILIMVITLIVCVFNQMYAHSVKYFRCILKTFSLFPKQFLF